MGPGRRSGDYALQLGKLLLHVDQHSAWRGNDLSVGLRGSTDGGWQLGRDEAADGQHLLPIQADFGIAGLVDVVYRSGQGLCYSG